jgi:osmoprotectant transport system ATP-binding protein
VTVRAERGASVALRAVSAARGGQPILRDVSLSIAPGERIAVLGPSGSGKTTLLEVVNRLVETTSGTVEIGGRDIRTLPLPALRRSVGYAFQALGLFPHLTIAENVGIGLRLAGERAAAIDARVHRLLDRVSLPRSLASRPPHELSGGQAQRVAVARALATSPPILLLDEPFGALDPETRASVQDELLAACAEEGPTTLLVTHDLAEAVTVADRLVVVLDGAVARVGTAREVLRAPGDPRIAALVEAARRGTRALEAALAPRDDRDAGTSRPA